MLQDGEARLEFTRAYNRTLVSENNIPPEIARRVFVDSMIEDGVFVQETFRRGRYTVGRTDLPTDEESGNSDDGNMALLDRVIHADDLEAEDAGAFYIPGYRALDLHEDRDLLG